MHSEQQIVQTLQRHYGRLISNLKVREKRLQQALKANPLASINNDRISTFWQHLAKMEALALNAYKRTEDEAEYELDQLFYTAYIRAVVDLDASVRPDIDPNEGWVRLSTIDYSSNEFERWLLDSQLMTLVFNSLTGGMCGWWLKSRKVNLLHGLAYSEPTNESFKFEVEGLGDSAPTLAVTKHTPGLIALRQTFKTTDFALHQEFMVKAGIGAHRNNATTGFTMDYWLEPGPILKASGEQLPAIRLQSTVLLPSRCCEAASCCILTPVGGVDDRVINLSSEICSLYELRSEGYVLNLKRCS